MSRQAIGRSPVTFLHRRRLGVSLVETLIAIGILSFLMLSGLAYLESQRQARLAELAADQLAVVADAAESYIDADFPTVLADVTAAGGSLEITLATLRTAGALPPAATDRDAMRRQMRVLLVLVGTDALDVVVGQAVAAGDGRRPVAGLLRPTGVRIGMVSPDATTRLRGPAIDADVSAHQTAFSGAPQAGALATLWRADFQSIFGDHLWRSAVPGFADANTMETALRMDTHDILGAGRIEAASLEISGTGTIGGDLTAQDVTVGSSLTSSGDVQATAALQAALATFTGAVTADSVTATGAVQAASATVTGNAQAGSFSATGAFAAGSATVGSLQASTITGQMGTFTNVSANQLTSGQLTVSGNVTAATAGFTNLTVSICNGC